LGTISELQKWREGGIDGTYTAHLYRGMQIESTSVPYLIRDGESGIYYARVKVGGKIKIRSLETDKVSTAKLRLNDKVDEIRESVPVAESLDLDHNSTFDDAFQLYKKDVESDTRLEPSTKEFRLRQAEPVRRVWPKVFEMGVRRITEDDLKTFLREFEGGKSVYRPHKSKGKRIKGNSPTVVNAIIAFFRRVFDYGVRAGVIAKNPASGLKRMRARKKLLELPTKAQFVEIVNHIRLTAGKGRSAADFVEGLAYTGLRRKEAKGLLWRHLDEEREMIAVHGTKTETSSRFVPMVPAFKELVSRIREYRGSESPDAPIFQVSEATNSLAKASTHITGKKMTHHDLRHLFATTCIESGTDIPTVAKWLGHADGGALAMKTYGHIRLYGALVQPRLDGRFIEQSAADVDFNKRYSCRPDRRPAGRRVRVAKDFEHLGWFEETTLGQWQNGEVVHLLPPFRV